MRNEKERLSNAAVVVMLLEGGKKVQARGLTMARALAWCDGAEQIDRLVTEAGQDRAKVAEAMGLMLEHLLDYDPSWPADEIREQATTNQVCDAFYTLWRDNDPLAIGERNKREAMAEQIALVEKVGGLSHLLAANPNGSIANS